MQAKNFVDTIESRPDCVVNATAESSTAITKWNTPMPSTMDIEIIRTNQALEAFRPEWEKFLEGEVFGDCFENDPANVEFALVNHPELSPFIIVCKKQEEIACVAAFRILCKKFKLQFGPLTLASLPIRCLKLYGDNFIYSKGNPQQEAIDAVFAVLQREKCHFDLVDISYPDCSSTLWRHCAELGRSDRRPRVVVTRSPVDFVRQIHLPSTHEAYIASLNPNTRQALRRNTRRIFKDGRGKLVKYTKPDQVQELLPFLDELYKNTWQAKILGFHSRNTERGRKRFELIARRGWLRSYLLFQDEHPIAYELGYQYRGRYYLTETGFDPKWAEFGPGMVLIHLIIEDLFKEAKPSVVDFGFGDSAYKRSFANGGHDAAYAYFAFSHYGRSLLKLQKTLDLLSSSGRSVLTGLRLDWLLKRLVKLKRWAVN